MRRGIVGQLPLPWPHGFTQGPPAAQMQIRLDSLTCHGLQQAQLSRGPRLE